MPFYLLNIINWLEAHQLPCLFKAVTHVDCPGCGMQTSLILLIKGEVMRSFFIYPALLPIILLFGFLILHLIKNYKNGSVILKYAYIFCAGIILISYIYKLTITKTV